jgi:hypothetical protein
MINHVVHQAELIENEFGGWAQLRVTYFQIQYGNVFMHCISLSLIQVIIAGLSFLLAQLLTTMYQSASLPKHKFPLYSCKLSAILWSVSSN